MQLIVALVMFSFSMWLAYRAFTYDSHSPRRWGVSEKAKICSRFSEVMQALMLLLFSVAFFSESMPPELRVLFPLLGFVGVFVGMFYDQYIRKQESHYTKLRKGSTGCTLSAGINRRLCELALVASIIGAGVGYVLAGLVSLGAVSPPFIALQVYIGAMAVPWVATILTLSSTHGKESAPGKPDPLKVVFREAPSWSKALPCIALAVSVVALLSIPAHGGSLRIANWTDGAPHTKAVFFLVVATMYCLPIPLLVALRGHALRKRDEGDY